MRVIRTIILVILAFCVLWIQPPFYAQEYKDYLPNLDSKLTNSPVGTYYETAKEYLYKYAGKFIISLTYRKVLVLNPTVDEHCVVYINTKPYYLAPIECTKEVQSVIETTFNNIGAKYIYFKQAPGSDEYKRHFNLDDGVKIGYFWDSMPDMTKLHEHSINLQIILNTKTKATAAEVPADTLWKKMSR